MRVVLSLSGAGSAAARAGLCRGGQKSADVAWRAQVRLCARYRKLIARGKRAPVACMAVARELATFIWEMGQVVPVPP